MKPYLSQRPSRLWLAVRWPNFTANALGVTNFDKSLIVEYKQRVFYASALAQEKGVQHNMDITTAKALSNCEVLTRDSKAELRLLQQLVDSLYQFTPHIEQQHGDYGAGVLLEISRCLKLFNGIKQLCADIFLFLNKFSFSFNKALGHTAQTAWLLSKSNFNITGREDKPLFIQRLHEVALQELHEFPKAVSTLEKSGFRTFGDLKKHIELKSIASLNQRFDQNFIEALSDIFDIDQSFQQGRLFQKPIATHQPQEFFKKRLDFDYPIRQVDLLKPAIESLLSQLTAYLRQRQLETQQIEWLLADIYHNKKPLNIICDYPQTHGSLFYDLTLIKLEHEPLAFEVDSFELSCTHTTVIQNRAQALPFKVSSHRTIGQSLALTLAKLKTALGEHAVFKLSYHDSLIPELSNQPIAAAQVANQSLPNLHKKALRPTWLFQTAQPVQKKSQGLYWRGYLRLLSKVERIESNWWDTPIARDYFLAERQDHLRVWIFLDLEQDSWFVQGVFA